jgi:hypothetical protein
MIVRRRWEIICKRQAVFVVGVKFAAKEHYTLKVDLQPQPGGCSGAAAPWATQATPSMPPQK